MHIRRIFIAILYVFLLIPGHAGASIIAGAECFIDTDPGEGNGIAMAALDGTFDEENEEFVCDVNLDTLNLKSGYHRVYCRVQNDSGQWSIARPILNDMLTITPNLKIINEKQIIEAECFIDTDPGEGNGIGCQCADGNCDEWKEEIQCENISTFGLSPGIHKVHCRMKDSDNLWGIIRSDTIQIYVPEPVLVAAEYFVNDDPGEGNGIQIPFPKDLSWDDPEEEVEIEINFPDYSFGEYLMQVRMKDNHDRWGMVDCKKFGGDPCEGNFDLDDSIDISDLLVFVANFGNDNCINQTACDGDFNGDRDVDGSDLSIFAKDFNRTNCVFCP